MFGSKVKAQHAVGYLDLWTQGQVTELNLNRKQRRHLNYPWTSFHHKGGWSNNF